MTVGKSRRRDVKKVSSWGPQWINATPKGSEPNLGVPQQLGRGGGLVGTGGMEAEGEVLGGWSPGESGPAQSGAGGPSCVEDRDDARWE